MNEKISAVQLSTLTDAANCFGSASGRAVFHRLCEVVERLPIGHMLGISLTGIDQLDACFARECIVKLAALKRARQGIFLTNLHSNDVRDNIDYAAQAYGLPLTVWEGQAASYIGLPMGRSTNDLMVAMKEFISATTPIIASRLEISVQNASTKLKRLVEQGYLLREEVVAKSGGIEHQYRLIGEPQG